MRYFDSFTGIVGFTLAIERAYVDSIKGGAKRRSEEDTERNERQGLLATQGESIRAEERLISEHNRDITNKGQPTCVGFSEIDKYASKIYQHHYPSHKNYGDISKINWNTVPDFDLLTGGTPCQDLSIAGKRAGLTGERSGLFHHFVRALEEKKPTYFIWESVKGALSSNKGWDFAEVLNSFSEAGYDVQWQVLNSKNFGVPQNRERVYIVGHSRGVSRPEVFPFGESLGNIKETNRQYPSISAPITGQGQQNCRGVFPATSGQIRRLTPTECARLQSFPDDWHKIDGISDTQTYKCYGNAITVNVAQAIIEKLI